MNIHIYVYIYIYIYIYEYTRKRGMLDVLNLGILNLIRVSDFMNN